MLEARTLSVSIEKDWHKLFDAISRPEFFPNWSSGLSKSSLQREGTGRGPTVRKALSGLRFTGPQSFRVMDHHVDVGSGSEIQVPRGSSECRRSGSAATSVRLPKMTDEKLEADADWVRRDLLAPKVPMTR
jgi:hypothetical protein